MALHLKIRFVRALRAAAVAFTLATAAASLAAASGCGSDTADWLPDDLDRAATLDRIGTAAFDRLCLAFEAYVRDQYRSDRLVQAACMAHAVSTTDSAAACATVLETCLDSPPPAVESVITAILAQASCEAVDVEPQGCLSTVGQIEACLDALGAAVDQVQFTLTCAAAGQSLDPEWYEQSLPSACSSLAMSCGPGPG